MGRRVGSLQRRIIGELAREPAKRLPRDELKRRFAKEVAQRTFYRALRSLRRQDLVYDQRGGKRAYLMLTVHGDEELLDLCNAAFAMLEAARARSVPVPQIAGPAPPSREPRRAGERRPDVGA